MKFLNQLNLLKTSHFYKWLVLNKLIMIYSKQRKDNKMTTLLEDLQDLVSQFERGKLTEEEVIKYVISMANYYQNKGRRS